jgi:prophage regulatory protein
MPQVQMLRLSAVLEKTGLSRSTVHRLEAQGKFPRRASLSGNAVGYLNTEIEEWIIDRLAARDAQEIAA